jgi:hypothetical protein
MLREQSAGRWVWGAIVGVLMAGPSLALAQPAPAQPPAGTAPATQPTPDRLPELRLGPLDRPLETPPTPPAVPPGEADVPPFLRTPMDPPSGFTGPSGIDPRDTQTSSHFIPVEDRWRLGFPAWDRYDKGHPRLDDYPYVEGNILNPFKQNVLKGDYPILGQHLFLNLTAINLSLVDYRQVPTPGNVFDSAARAGQYEVFGKPGQFLFTNFTSLRFDLFHGDAAFKQPDWRVVIMPVFNYNYLNVNEVGIVSPDVRNGTDRQRTYLALQEWFVESKLADLGPDFDFVSARVGSQDFDNDFRGFLFDDVNRAVRLFGTRFSNRDQFNLIYLKQLEKDTNSELNTFHDRHQDIFFANYFRQDFIFPGYTAEASFAYNHDRKSFHFDENGFLVRPDPAGVFTPHDINVFYVGLGGDGHIGKINITNQFYWAFGRDGMNPIANCPQDISAEMVALELSYDRDWMRFRTSFFWASGDGEPNNKTATGFDTILDNPNFAGGEFSYWVRQRIGLLGVGLKQPFSLVPDLRSSKIQGQSNFVNPGLWLANFGMDADLTPKLKWINNANLLWFDETPVLETFVYQEKIHHFIGTDLSTGFEYRPLLSNNIVMTFGASTLITGRGFRDLYSNLTTPANSPLFAAFMELKLLF